jgi:hypothetical protein
LEVIGGKLKGESSKVKARKQDRSKIDRGRRAQGAGNGKSERARRLGSKKAGKQNGSVGFIGFVEFILSHWRARETSQPLRSHLPFRCILRRLQPDRPLPGSIPEARWDNVLGYRSGPGLCLPSGGS